LKNKDYFIFRFKKEPSTNPLFTYEDEICSNLYKFSYLKHSKILNPKFINILNLITKKFDIYHLNLMLYKILCESAKIYCIEE
jgi:hypothetical protein